MITQCTALALQLAAVNASNPECPARTSVRYLSRVVHDAGNALIQTQLVDLVVATGQHLAGLSQEEGAVGAAVHGRDVGPLGHVHLHTAVPRDNTAATQGAATTSGTGRWGKLTKNHPYTGTTASFILQNPKAAH